MPDFADVVLDAPDELVDVVAVDEQRVVVGGTALEAQPLAKIGRAVPTVDVPTGILTLLAQAMAGNVSEQDVVVRHYRMLPNGVDRGCWAAPPSASIATRPNAGLCSPQERKSAG